MSTNIASSKDLSHCLVRDSESMALLNRST